MSGTRHYPDIIQAEALALRETGRSVRYIAAYLQEHYPEDAPTIHNSTVTRWCRDLQHEQLTPQRQRVSAMHLDLLEIKLEEALDNPDKTSLKDAAITRAIDDDKDMLRQKQPNIQQTAVFVIVQGTEPKRD